MGFPGKIGKILPSWGGDYLRHQSNVFGPFKNYVTVKFNIFRPHPFVTHFYCLPIVQNNRCNKSLDTPPFLSRYVIFEWPLYICKAENSRHDRREMENVRLKFLPFGHYVRQNPCFQCYSRSYELTGCEKKRASINITYLTCGTTS